MLLAPNSFNSLQKDLFPTNAKKNSAPTIIAPGVAEGGGPCWGWAIERLQKLCIYIFFNFWCRWQMAFTCSKQWKHEFLKYVKCAWKPMYIICLKSTIKPQERDVWCFSGVFIINVRGVGIQDLVEHLRWSFFCNSIGKC